MPLPIILIEVALLFFALGVIVHALWAMKREDEWEMEDFSLFNPKK